MVKYIFEKKNTVFVHCIRVNCSSVLLTMLGRSGTTAYGFPFVQSGE